MPDENTPVGLIAAITTPFNADNTIDDGAFVAHFQWMYQNGIQRILIAGTTGEFFSLTVDERKHLLQLAAKHFNGHIMFHAGAGSLVDTLDLSIFAANEGAHSVAVILPWFLAELEHRGVVSYFSEISAVLDVPFLIYNFPRHTQVRLTPAILAEINHFGIKDSSGDLSLIPHTPNYFIGSDRRLLSAYAVGARGFISARANGYPSLYAELDTASREDPESEKSRLLHAKVCNVCDLLSGNNQIQLVKKTIRNAVPGYPTSVRLPLV
jgi:dihydrodipicolinate synthase/N-acetylneuraminate lyase